MEDKHNKSRMFKMVLQTVMAKMFYQGTTFKGDRLNPVKYSSKKRATQKKRTSRAKQKFSRQKR